MSEEKKNILHMMYDKDGYPTWQTQLSPEENKIRATVIVPPDHVMPVVFIPGIMGSNLKFIKPLDWFNGGSNIAWRPDASWFTGKTFGNLNPAQRRMVLNPENTVIDESGEIPDSILRFFKNVSPNVQANWKSEFARRGWGSVYLNSYGEILCNLEWNLNHIYDFDQKVTDQGHALSSYWQKDILGVEAATNHYGEAKQHPWGEIKSKEGYEFLNLSDLKEKVGDKYWFPVHAAGYNWLHSNEDAGKDIAKRINEIITHYQNLKFDCKKVIIVTHSMGGLAARAACHPKMGQLEKLKLVAGVVHGEQPALGAAAAYKRMHAGFEGLPWIARALGWSGKEVTAVLANARGGLELLPTKRYPAGWLRVQAEGRDLMQLPKSDPYEEIYRKRNEWWRLMNPEWIEPSTQPPPKNELDNIWKEYLKRLKLVEKFHDDLGDYYHDVTHTHYGADFENQAWTNFTWKLDKGFRKDEVTTDAPTAEFVETDALGVITIRSHFLYSEYKMSKPDLPGDGTVPAVSGADTAIKAKFAAKMTGFDHQGSYANKAVKDVTTYSVARIAKDT
jgi:pimeloyl-ACP methyl ester carboxylesterase